MWQTFIHTYKWTTWLLESPDLLDCKTQKWIDYTGRSVIFKLVHNVLCDYLSLYRITILRIKPLLCVSLFVSLHVTFFPIKMTNFVLCRCLKYWSCSQWSDCLTPSSGFQEPPCPPRLQQGIWRTSRVLIGFLMLNLYEIYTATLIHVIWHLLASPGWSSLSS